MKFTIRKNAVCLWNWRTHTTYLLSPSGRCRFVKKGAALTNGDLPTAVNIEWRPDRSRRLALPRWRIVFVNEVAVTRALMIRTNDPTKTGAQTRHGSVWRRCWCWRGCYRSGARKCLCFLQLSCNASQIERKIKKQRSILIRSEKGSDLVPNLPISSQTFQSRPEMFQSNPEMFRAVRGQGSANVRDQRSRIRDQRLKIRVRAVLRFQGQWSKVRSRGSAVHDNDHCKNKDDHDPDILHDLVSQFVFRIWAPTLSTQQDQTTLKEHLVS